MDPFLKWAGGKRWLRKELSQIQLECRQQYIEPFVGSGAAFFDRMPNRALLSDSNADLIDTYIVVRDHPRDLIRELDALAKLHSDDFYYQVRSRLPSDTVEKAARFIYLNRTCWNGLYRVNKLGKFNVPRGTKNQIMLPNEDFFKTSAALKAADIVCCDFERIIDTAQAGDLVYCDPPYTVHHNFNGFLKYNETIFSWQDQIRLRDTIVRAIGRGVKVAISNARHPSILELYDSFENIRELDRASVISGLKKGRGSYAEVLICA